MRGIGSIVVAAVILVALAGCKPGWFETREPWRAEAEQQCLKSGAVRESAAVALLRPIQGPGICGADFPLKVAALGESTALGYADDLRPPGAVPMAGPVYSPSPTYAAPPSPYPRAPVMLAPASARAPADDRYTPDPRYTPDTGYRPGDDDIIVPNTPDLRARPVERWRDAPRTVAPAPPPRAAPAPLGPARAPITTTAAVQPAATLACPIVSALDRWIVDSVQPSAMRWFGQPVVEIQQISAYSCRGMNGQPGARISEHAFGNALDIAAFTLADGRKLTVKDGWRGVPEEQGFLRDIQAAACEQFTTVLAPGSNRFHYDHIHVDLMRRSSGSRICNPEAASGDEVAARAARNGRSLAQREEPYDRRDDPFAWRGGARGRDAGPTGSVKPTVRRRAYSPHDISSYADDEEALID